MDIKKFNPSSVAQYIIDHYDIKQGRPYPFSIPYWYYLDRSGNWKCYTNDLIHLIIEDLKDTLRSNCQSSIANRIKLSYRLNKLESRIFVNDVIEELHHLIPVEIIHDKVPI